MAERYFRRALHQTRAAGDDEGAVTVSLRWGQALSQWGHYHRALYRICFARRHLQPHQTEHRAHLLNSLGLVYHRLGWLRQARRIFTEVLDAIQHSQNPYLHSAVMGNAGMVLFELHDHRAAEPYLREALAPAQALKAPTLAMKQAGTLGNVLRAMGQLDEAEIAYRLAVDLAQQLQDRENYELGIGSLGILLLDKAHYAEASSYLVEAITISLEQQRWQQAAITLVYLGRIAEMMNNPSEALGHYSRAVSYCELNLQSHLAPADTLTTLHGAYIGIATLHWHSGDHDAAQHVLQQANALLARYHDPYNLSQQLTVQSYFAYEAGRVDEALALFEHAYAQAHAIGNVYSEFRALLNRVGILSNRGHYDLAMPLAQTALDMTRRLHLVVEEREALEALGRLHWQQGQVMAAVACLQVAVALLDSGRAQIVSIPQRMGFLELREAPFVGLVNLLVATAQPVIAWHTVEQARSRTLVDMLALTPLACEETEITRPILQWERSLTHEISGYLRTFFHATTAPTMTQLQAIQKLQSDLKTTWEQLEPYLPDYIALRRGRPLTWMMTRRLLNPTG